MGALSAVINDDSGRFPKIFFFLGGGTYLKQYTTKLLLGMISSIRHRVDIVFALQGRVTAFVGN
jgi:hypothetical protein